MQKNRKKLIRPVGNIFCYNGGLYKVIERYDGCEECAFSIGAKDNRIFDICKARVGTRLYQITGSCSEGRSKKGSYRNCVKFVKLAGIKRNKQK